MTECSPRRHPQGLVYLNALLGFLVRSVGGQILPPAAAPTQRMESTS